jgi:hypothetical protein
VDEVDKSWDSLHVREKNLVANHFYQDALQGIFWKNILRNGYVVSEI